MIIRRVVDDYRVVDEVQFTEVAYANIWQSQRAQLGPLVRNPGFWYAIPSGGNV